MRFYCARNQGLLETTPAFSGSQDMISVATSCLSSILPSYTIIKLFDLFSYYFVVSMIRRHGPVYGAPLSLMREKPVALTITQQPTKGRRCAFSEVLKGTALSPSLIVNVDFDQYVKTH
jgi:hypothetical protein